MERITHATRGARRSEETPAAAGAAAHHRHRDQGRHDVIGRVDGGPPDETVPPGRLDRNLPAASVFDRLSLLEASCATPS
jgi:hypothetical protein